MRLSFAETDGNRVTAGIDDKPAVAFEPAELVAAQFEKRPTIFSGQQRYLLEVRQFRGTAVRDAGRLR